MSDTTTTNFADQRLDAYRVAMELFREVEAVAAGLRRGHADLKDQVRRAAAATVRHIAEGANRVHPRDKAARFMVARGEVGECAAALEMAAVIGVVAAARAARLQRLGDRVAAMLWGLVKRERARTG